jgi:hypothetical protein
MAEPVKNKDGVFQQTANGSPPRRAAPSTGPEPREIQIQQRPKAFLPDRTQNVPPPQPPQGDGMGVRVMSRKRFEVRLERPLKLPPGRCRLSLHLALAAGGGERRFPWKADQLRYRVAEEDLHGFADGAELCWWIEVRCPGRAKQERNRTCVRLVP